jgi:hypothetical protein
VIDDMLLIGIAAGVIVTLAVVGIAWRLLRRRTTRIASPEEAAEAAEQALAGFDTQGAVVGADGGGALAVDRAGRVAVMKRDGKRMAVRDVRRLAPADLKRLVPELRRA